MGRVFLGLSAGGRPVAVKVIRAELAADEEFRVRFGREVAAARRVSGLFTALVVDADVDGEVPWLATAYVAGPSLAEAVASNGPMSARPALALAAGLAEGLSAIHAASVVHCDLKPSNVLLSQDGPRVIDFGISRAAEAVPVSVTGDGMIVGSPGFMSPEQAMGEEIGPASDVFSLGAVLAFAATGRGPFGEGSGPEVAYRLVYAEPALDHMPSELRSLVERCLAKEAQDRPTAGELLTEVAALQAATGWLPDAALGALAEYAMPRPGAVPPVRSASLVPAEAAAVSKAATPDRDRGSRRRVLRPLAASTVAASILAASVAVGVVLSSSSEHHSASPPAPQVAAARASASPGASARATSPSAPGNRSSSAGNGPGPLPEVIIPAADKFTSPDVSPSPSVLGNSSPSQSPAASVSPTASPSPSASVSASATPSPSPSPSPSTSPAQPVPRITTVGTYREGAWVYFEIHYADPGQDAQGFGFTGSNGNNWVEGTYSFASPGRGVAGPDSIAYPLDLACGTAKPHKADIEAWIYDTAGVSSKAVVIDLACSA